MFLLGVLPSLPCLNDNDVESKYDHCMCRFLLEPHLLLFSFFLNLVDLLVQATSLKRL